MINSLNIRNAIGEGGDISIITGRLSITGGAQILTNTLGQGKAGSVFIEADQIAISGFRFDNMQPSSSNAFIIFPSAVYSNTGEFAVGDAGNIKIRTNVLTINNRGLLNVGTLGKGDAGSIEISAQAVSMDNAAISATSNSATGEAGGIQVQAKILRLRNFSQTISENISGRGGDIDITPGEVLLLREQSSISTTAGLRGTGGDGGNISINAAKGFIIAPLHANSDIRANAYTGKGGTVQINAQGVFGFQTPLQPMSKTNDITATSQFGISGRVTLNQVDLDPSRGLAELPTTPTDPSNQIDQSCSPETQAISSFTSVGRGGIAANPGDFLNDEKAAANWVTLNRHNMQISSTQAIQATDPVTEAQTWRRDVNGDILLLAQTSPSISHSVPSCLDN